jgi:uroporphyrinogen-III synthase
MLLRKVKSIANVLALLTLTIFLTSCAGVKPLEVFTKEVERTPLNLESPQPPKMENINWVIITSENADEVFAKLKEDGKDQVLFGLSDDDYELIAKNFAQIRAYIIQQDATLEKYKEYYEPTE